MVDQPVRHSYCQRSRKRFRWIDRLPSVEGKAKEDEDCKG
jgi:hypothetical protein